MPHEVLVPAELDSDPSLSVVRDPTAPDGLSFVHGEAAKPLATPWQVSAERAALLNPDRLPVGAVLDVACGSGVQLAALAAILERPAIGVELDPSRARASAQNLHAVASWFGALEPHGSCNPASSWVMGPTPRACSRPWAMLPLACFNSTPLGLEIQGPTIWTKWPLHRTPCFKRGRITGAGSGRACGAARPLAAPDARPTLGDGSGH